MPFYSVSVPFANDFTFRQQTETQEDAQDRFLLAMVKEFPQAVLGVAQAMTTNNDHQLICYIDADAVLIPRFMAWIHTLGLTTAVTYSQLTDMPDQTEMREQLQLVLISYLCRRAQMTEVKALAHDLITHLGPLSQDRFQKLFDQLERHARLYEAAFDLYQRFANPQ